MEALQSILINTYNPNQRLRKEAENALQDFVQTPGSLPVLVQTVSAPLHRDLRQATALLIKNRLRDYWSDKEGGLPASDADKAHAKNTILVALLVETDNSVRGILAECIRIMSEFEFPERWPELLPTLVQNMQSPEVLHIYNALLALRKLVKRYEYKDKEHRQPLFDIINQSFPCMQALMQHVMAFNTLEAASVLRLCFKVFWSCTNYQLPLVEVIDVNMWFQTMMDIMAKYIPEANENIEPLHQPVNPEERVQWPWWKLKKWVGRILNHFIQRYGNPKYSNEANKSFAEFFKSTLSVRILPCLFVNLHWKTQNKYVADHVIRSSLSFLSSAAEMAPSYKAMKPQLSFLLVEVIFPCLCITHDEIELFESDPQEYVRRLHDPSLDWLSPQQAASTLLQMLARYRQADTLPVFLPFLQGILAEYHAGARTRADCIKKDGVLVAMATIAKILNDSPAYAPHLLPFIVTHLMPEFASPQPFMRARAAWCVEFFSVLDWEGLGNASGKKGKKNKKKGKTGAAAGGYINVKDVLNQIVTCLFAAMRDVSLPVQAAAAISLQSLLKGGEEGDGDDDDEEGGSSGLGGVREVLRPRLRELIAEYFRIMEEVENESVLSALQCVVEAFGDDLSEIAYPMAEQLVKCFFKYAQDVDEEESAFNAIHCLDILDTLVEGVQDSGEVLASLPSALTPLFLYVLQGGGDMFEYIDTVVHMISGFVYLLLPPPPAHPLQPLLHKPPPYTYMHDTTLVWNLLPPLAWALGGEGGVGIDYLSEMIPPLLTYLTRDIGKYMQARYGSGGVGGGEGVGVPDLVWRVVLRAFEIEEGYYGHDLITACTYLSTLFVTAAPVLPSPILSPHLVQILTLLTLRRNSIKKKRVKNAFFEVFMSLVYYDARGVISFLSQPLGAIVGGLLSGESASNWLELAQPLPAMETSGIEFWFGGLFGHVSKGEGGGMAAGEVTPRLTVLSYLALMDLRCSAPSNSLPALIEANFPILLTQAIREVAYIEEEEQQRHDKRQNGDDDDDDDDDEDFDEDEEDFDDSNPKQAKNNRAKALYVPEGGYGEEEDCENAEDEDYRAMLEELDREERVKRQVFKAKKSNTTADNDGEEDGEDGEDGEWHDMDGGDGDAVYDEDIDQDTYAFVSPIQQLDMVSTLFLTLTHIGSRPGVGGLVDGWRAALASPDQEKLGQMYQLFMQRRAQQS